MRRFASPFDSSTLPGAFARLRFEVKAQTTTVFILLWNHPDHINTFKIIIPNRAAQLEGN
jgi:hypothetical protein